MKRPIKVRKEFGMKYDERNGMKYETKTASARVSRETSNEGVRG